MSQRGPRRCVWTNRGSRELVAIEFETIDRFALGRKTEAAWVLPEPEEDSRRFNDYVVRWGPTFLLGLLALTVLAIVAAALEWTTVVGVAVVLIGGLMVVFPFATPETVTLVGVRSAILFARIAGVVTMIVGIGLIALFEVGG